MNLLDRFGFTDELIEQRKVYLGLTDEDVARIREAHESIHPYADRIIDRFYDYLLAHPQTAEVIRSFGVERLKELQSAYFRRLTEGTYDRDYVENRLRVGLAHQRIGLDPVWYLGAYNTYTHLVADVLREAFGDDSTRYDLTMISLTKIIHFDMSLALDAYILSAQEALKDKAFAMERLEESKQQLTDMIVHDLQNPLAGIRAFLDHLKGRPQPLSESEVEALDEARRRCSDLNAMIMNVLEIRRAEEGKLEAYLENLDLGELVRGYADEFRLVAERSGLTFDVRVPSAPLPARADQQLLRRILQNLIINGIRHATGATRITVGVEASSDGGAQVFVEDDGGGIAAEHLDLIFEPFGSAELRKRGVRVDTGLGLRFCRLAAEVQGATIRLESGHGRGTRAIITIASTTA